MAEYCVVPEACVVAVDKAFDFKAAALVGCGVTTGVGAAIKTAEVKPGSTVAVFGCGGVGLNVVQGARIAGAARVIAVDLSAEKMEMARAFGATDTVTPGGDSVKEILDMTGGMGVDYAFEVVGNGKLIEACFKATRANGTCTLVGVGRMDDRFSFNAAILPFTGKTIKGCMYGSANFKVDFPMYLELYRQKKLDLDGLVTRTYSIDEAAEAFAHGMGAVPGILAREHAGMRRRGRARGVPGSPRPVPLRRWPGEGHRGASGDASQAP
jgi:S-(hydroxymethyl)glutathione dehydrogenase/alcohol dehydrogenase